MIQKPTKQMFLKLGNRRLCSKRSGSQEWSKEGATMCIKKSDIAERRSKALDGRVRPFGAGDDRCAKQRRTMRAEAFVLVVVAQSFPV